MATSRTSCQLVVVPPGYEADPLEAVGVELGDPARGLLLARPGLLLGIGKVEGEAPLLAGPRELLLAEGHSLLHRLVLDLADIAGAQAAPSALSQIALDRKVRMNVENV